MNTMKKYFKERNGEKGIALLFTLGMLTVLLVLAMGFATTSITQRKNAANNIYGTTARLLAESTLERVMGTLQNYDVSQFIYSHCDANSHPKKSPSDPENWGTSDWLYKIETSETGPISGYGDVNWEYITVNGKIVGRVAYIIVSVGN